MAKPAIEVSGTRELNRALKRASGRTDLLKQAHQRLAAPLVALAKVEAPTRSGTLAGNIRASATQRAISLKAGGKRVPYAGVIHYGWQQRGIAPNPYLERARDAMLDQVVDGYRREVDELVEQVTRDSLTRP